LSYLSPQPEQSSSEEIELLTALFDLPISGTFQAIRKTSANSFTNVNMGGSWGSIAGTLSDQTDIYDYINSQIAVENLWDRTDTTITPHTAGDNVTTTGTGTFGDLVVDTDTLVVNATGYEDRVGIGTATPSQALDVVGTAQATIFNATDEDNALQIDGTTILRTGKASNYNIFLGEDAFANDDGKYNLHG